MCKHRLINMGFRNIYALLSVLALMVVGCAEYEAEDAHTLDKVAVLTLTSEDLMVFTSEGGKGEITYTAELRELTRSGAQPKVGASCSADWITLKGADNSCCSFTVAANEGEARQTTIVISYDVKKVEVTITQTAKGAGSETGSEPELRLTSEEMMEFTSQGGLGEITYAVDNPKEGVRLTVQCAEAWITGIAVAESVTFTVLANEGAVRQATIVATYGEQSFEVIVRQLAKGGDGVGGYSVQFVANHFDGEYYGDYYSPGIGNYYLHLSDNGFKESGYALPKSRYYRIDLYSDYYGGPEVEHLQLPYGTYTLDTANSFQHGTFSVAYSKMLESDAEGNFVIEKLFEAGELVVDAKGATLRVTIEGVEHVVTYSGATLVSDKRSATGEDVGGGEEDDTEDVLSTLVGDYTLTLDDHMLIYAYYGDYYNTGLRNWTFALWPNDHEGDHIQFDIINESDTDMFGTYSLGDESRAYSFLVGYIESDGTGDTIGYMRGSWYYTDDGVTMAPFAGGELRITDGGGGDIVLDIEATDDRGNRLKGSWRGRPEALK